MTTTESTVDLAKYVWLPLGVWQGLVEQRRLLKEVYAALPDGAEKDEVKTSFYMAEEFANGLNFQYRNTLLGAQGDSMTTPIAPELSEADLLPIE